MAKFILINLSVVLMLLTYVWTIQAKDCPTASKNYICTPRCYKDSDCASIAGKCCPNLCNQNSCVAPHMLTNSGDKYGTKPDKYGGSGSVYCGNVKCGPFEKCEVDRITKREKCVRA
ncbi:uncharacterized protein LOC111680496 [Lucilia cuprina]|uniref:uncharacterized protein LOC111680496 n=1 Tax=Lucilia cuprina TaxID=7375 RepID=UPI001F056065|nr:uncharacterized protein LOC111680496 [Lucilia cuprina]